MSLGLGITLAFIAFCQIAFGFGVAYLAIGWWVQGKPRAYISATIAAAYLVGRLQQAFDDSGWENLSDPKMQIILATYVVTLLLFALRTNKVDRIATD